MDINPALPSLPAHIWQRTGLVPTLSGQCPSLPKHAGTDWVWVCQCQVAIFTDVESWMPTIFNLIFNIQKDIHNQYMLSIKYISFGY